MSDRTEPGADEAFTLPHLVKWVEMVVRAEAEQAMGHMAVTSGQLFVLVLLESRGEATSAELARMMRVTPQALTTLLAPLRDLGCIERRADAAHARRLLLRLTARGRKIIEEARQLTPGIEAEILAGFTAEERDVLKRLLGRIAQRLG